MNIIEKYNQDKETTIQADISEFLHFNFSNYIMQQLKCRKDPNVKKLLSLFPLQPDTRKSEIKKIIDKLENILSYDLLDDIKDEFPDVAVIGVIPELKAAQDTKEKTAEARFVVKENTREKKKIQWDDDDYEDEE